MLGHAHQERLTRSGDGFIAGICEGLGHRFGVNPNWIRLGWLVAVLFFGTGILLYLALWWIVPHERSLPADPVVWIRKPNASHPPMLRTHSDRKLLGVCGGIARRFSVDPTYVRLGALTLFTVSGGLALVAYLIAAIVVPSQPARLRVEPHPVEL